MMPTRQAPSMPDPNPAPATHPPTDVHAGDHAPGDIQFLFHMAGNLRASLALADQHRQEGQHPDVAALAGDIAATHSAQLVQAVDLKARLSSATAGAATSSGAGATASGGHGAGGGYGGEGGGGRSRGLRSGRPGAELDRWDEQERSSPRSGEFERSVPFEMVASGDGLTLEGYAAVFDTVARIRDYEGEFDEVIRPGAFRDQLRERIPVLMFNHGKHPLIGDLPLGVINHAEEDSRGLYVRARLSDNWLIEPVRDAVRDGGVRGMSFRLQVPEGGDRWTRRTRDVELRELLRIQSRELGPVVFPAYEPTTVSVRSALDCIDCDTGRPGARSAGGGDPLRAAPGNGSAHVPSALRTRDRVLRMRGILRA